MTSLSPKHSVQSFSHERFEAFTTETIDVLVIEVLQNATLYRTAHSTVAVMRPGVNGDQIWPARKELRFRVSVFPRELLNVLSTERAVEVQGASRARQTLRDVIQRCPPRNVSHPHNWNSLLLDRHHRCVSTRIQTLVSQDDRAGRILRDDQFPDSPIHLVAIGYCRFTHGLPEKRAPTTRQGEHVQTTLMGGRNDPVGQVGRMRVAS